MANPVVVSLPDGEWTLVAENVVTGFIKKLSASEGVHILETYRLTGEAAPTLKAEGALAFEDSVVEVITSTVAIDVYMWADGAACSVRADI